MPWKSRGSSSRVRHGAFQRFSKPYCLLYLTAVPHNLLHRGWDFAVDVELRWLFLENSGKRIGRCGARESVLASEHLIQHDAKTEQIRPLVERLATNLPATCIPRSRAISRD